MKILIILKKISKSYRIYLDPGPDLDPDPVPHRNEMDPKHC